MEEVLEDLRRIPMHADHHNLDQYGVKYDYLEFMD